MQALEEIAESLTSMDKNEIISFFKELLTPAEITTLSKRWNIVKMLASGEYTQRDVAKKLNVSLCKVTRGAKILKTSNAITKRIIKGEEQNGCKR